MDVMKEAFQTPEGRVPPRTHFKPRYIETSITLQWNHDRLMSILSIPRSTFYAQECRQDEVRERIPHAGSSLHGCNIDLRTV